MIPGNSPPTLRPIARLLSTVVTAQISEDHWRYFWSQSGAQFIWDLAESTVIDGRESNRRRVTERRMDRLGVELDSEGSD